MRQTVLIAALAVLPLPVDAGPVEDGQRAAKLHCGRCHVVPGGNPFGSIGSTPSFAVMRGYENWEARFRAFYTEPPHIAITQIDGVTEAFDPARPSPVAPMVMSEADVDAILAFLATIEPKDVGRID